MDIGKGYNILWSLRNPGQLMVPALRVTPLLFRIVSQLPSCKDISNEMNVAVGDVNYLKTVVQYKMGGFAGCYLEDLKKNQIHI